jgi:hypothetical protein
MNWKINASRWLENTQKSAGFGGKTACNPRFKATNYSSQAKNGLS